MPQSFDVLRPADLLNLRVTAQNLRLDTTDPNQPALVVDQANSPAWLAVQLPPQTIAEHAFFEASDIKPEPIPGRVDQPNGALTTPGTAAAGAATVAQLAHPSRLVFDVPPGTAHPLHHRWAYHLGRAAAAL